MRWKLCTVGKPSLDYAKSGADLYLTRLRRYAKVDWNPVRDSADLLKAGEGTLRVVFDERGDSITTGQWVRRIDGWELDGVKTVSLIIGGAEGHTDAVRDFADETWNLSGLTLQHELALVVVLEGLYRCYTIKRGEPYHRS